MTPPFSHPPNKNAHAYHAHICTHTCIHTHTDCYYKKSSRRKLLHIWHQLEAKTKFPQSCLIHCSLCHFSCLKMARKNQSWMTLDDRNQKVLAAGKAREATLWLTRGVQEGMSDSHRLRTEGSLIPEPTTPYWAVQWSWFARVNAHCNLSRKKSQAVAASFPGQFMSRHCIMLCITMEAETRIVKQYKCHHCCSCKNYWGNGMDGRKKVSVSFFGWQEDREFVKKNAFWGIL